jgi:hypothetical protein
VRVVVRGDSDRRPSVRLCPTSPHTRDMDIDDLLLPDCFSLDETFAFDASPALDEKAHGPPPDVSVTPTSAAASSTAVPPHGQKRKQTAKAKTDKVARPRASRPPAAPAKVVASAAAAATTRAAPRPRQDREAKLYDELTLSEKAIYDMLWDFFKDTTYIEDIVVPLLDTTPSKPAAGRKRRAEASAAAAAATDDDSPADPASSASTSAGQAPASRKRRDRTGKMPMCNVNALITTFITNRSIRYQLTPDPSSPFIDLGASYCNMMKQYGKGWFDCFRRKTRVKWPLQSGSYFVTTLCQLNFFKWAISFKVLDLATQYSKQLDEHVEATRRDANARKQQKQDKLIPTIRKTKQSPECKPCVFSVPRTISVIN